MKKAITIVLCVVLLAGAAAGGWYLYKTATPEYALAETISDTKEAGLDGLRSHLTENAKEKIDAVGEWSERTGITGILSALTQDAALSVLKENLADVEWTVDDVLKGKNRADVVIGFNYSDKVTGTIEITMIREDNTWKIDGLGTPRISSVSLG